jgi:hypothetical protein
MTAQSDPYVRVYYRIIDDPKFADVYDDKVTLGWWLTLLLAADAMYPAPANLPRRLPKTVLDRLVGAGLVDLIGSDRFRLHGLNAERDKRTEAGKAGASARWSQSDRNATAMRPHTERTAKAMHSTPSNSAPIRTAPNHSSVGSIDPQPPLAALNPELAKWAKS